MDSTATLSSAGVPQNLETNTPPETKKTIITSFGSIKDLGITSILGIILGFGFYFLVEGYLRGIGTFLFACGLLASYLWVMKRIQKTLTIDMIIYSILFIIFTGLNVYRAGLTLSLLNFAGAVMSFSFLFLASMRRSVDSIPTFLWIFAPFHTLRLSLMGVFQWLQEWQVYSKGMARGSVVNYIRGFLLAAPFFLIILNLFMSADVTFQTAVNSIFQADFVAKLFRIGIYSAIFLGLFSIVGKYLKIHTEEDKKEVPEFTISKDRTIQGVIALSTLCVLFLIFVGFQITNLIGGETLLRNAEYTYSEYAREGFKQLITVACVVFGAFWIIDGYITAYRKSPGSQIYKISSGILFFLTYIVLISAGYRLWMYQQAYGFTEIRFYTYISLITIALSLGVAAYKSQRFLTEGRFWSLIVSIFATMIISANLVNPESFIVMRNQQIAIQKAQSLSRTSSASIGYSSSYDFNYIGNFSSDAIDSLLSIYDTADARGREILRKRICSIEGKAYAQISWQQWTISSTYAQYVLDSRKDISCDPPVIR